MDPVDPIRLGRDDQPGFDQPLVVAVARPKHHPVVAQGDRPAVAVGGDVTNRQNCHGVAGSRIDKSTLPIYRNATGALMGCLTALKI
jgi:hypothetical protein